MITPCRAGSCSPLCFHSAAVCASDTGLSSLILSGNRLTSVAPGALGGCAGSLTVLDLAGNRSERAYGQS